MSGPRFISVETADDPRVEPFLNIRERDLVGRQGRFIAEGEVVLAALADAPRARALAVLIDPRRREKLTPILERLGDMPVYLASQPVLDAIAGFHLHRGILALGERVTAPSPEDLLSRVGERALVVVACGIANHDNLGGLFRNAAAFGADAVLLDATSCDPLYRKALRVSTGSVLKLPFARFAPGADIPGLLDLHGFAALALTPRGGEPLDDLVPPPRTALLLGAEGPGLPPAMMARARRVTIEMAGDIDSLNLAAAAAVALHRLRAR